jgi:hypothetical protein
VSRENYRQPGTYPLGRIVVSLDRKMPRGSNSSRTDGVTPNASYGSYSAVCRRETASLLGQEAVTALWKGDFLGR